MQQNPESEHCTSEQHDDKSDVDHDRLTIQMTRDDRWRDSCAARGVTLGGVGSGGSLSMLFIGVIFLNGETKIFQVPRTIARIGHDFLDPLFEPRNVESLLARKLSAPAILLLVVPEKQPLPIATDVDTVPHAEMPYGAIAGLNRAI
jgi:hypothetical protein